MSKNRKNGLIVFGGGGLLLMLLLGLVLGPGIMKVIAAPPSPDFACTDVQNKAKFLAYDPDTKGDNFGPAVKATNVDEAQAELHARRCTDPALVTAHAAYYGVDGLSLPMSQQAFEDAVKAAKKEPATVWRSRIEAVEAYEKTGELSITTSTKRYDTLFFREGDKKSVVPTLYAGPVRDKVSTLFTVRHGDVVKKLKLECGFQPFEQDFPGTPGKPTTPTTPGTTTPTTPTTPGQPNPTPGEKPSKPEKPVTPDKPCVDPGKPGDGKYTYNPETCVWKKVGQTFDEQQNGDTGVRQDPQDNTTSGSYTGPTIDTSTGQPIKEPAVQDPAPVDNRATGDKAPDPTTNGTNSGSADGSGTPSGTTTDSSGTTVGGTVTNEPDDSQADAAGDDNSGMPTSP